MSASGAGPVQVLVVGSDADAVAFLTAMVNRGGLHAVPAATAGAAAAANDHAPGVVLVDRDLAPVRSIRALADPRKASTPILFLGNENAPDDEETDAETAGVTHYVTRPVPEAVLLDDLRFALGPA